MANTPPKTLRLRSFAITNYRTFHERTEIDFTGDVTVFHGETGSGKSTALAALDVFMRVMGGFLAGVLDGTLVLPWAEQAIVWLRFGDLLTERDRPIQDAPTVFEGSFEYAPETTWRAHFAPMGDRVGASVGWNRSQRPSRSDPEADDLVRRFFPFGGGSRPLAVLDARRRPRWLSPGASGSLLAPELASELYALRISKIAADRERWRSFAETVAGFPTLAGATISIEAGNPPELIVEHRGRVVLGLSELSSGEQELVALTAGLLLARAAIVAVEEPEMGLDAKTQGLWRNVCEKQLRAGFVHQFIFESHTVTFDGQQVVRFRRDGSAGPTHVEKVAAHADDALTQKAREKGAKQAFVTADVASEANDSVKRSSPSCCTKQTSPWSRSPSIATSQSDGPSYYTSAIRLRTIGRRRSIRRLEASFVGSSYTDRVACP